MNGNNKVIWNEGLLLQQQHFQQQERFFLHQLHAVSSMGQRQHWGFSRLELDTSMLAQGKLALRAATGLFPDGTVFTLPDDHPLPEPLDITEQDRDCEIVLALALVRPGEAESGTHPGRRYTVHETGVMDNHQTGGGNALLQTGQLSLHLLRRDQLSGTLTALGICRVREKQFDQQLQLYKEYIPPCLDCRASPVLRHQLAELIGLLQQRGDLLASRLIHNHGGQAAKLSDFLLLMLINRNQPLLAHLAEQPGTHPVDLYGLLLQLEGELASFHGSKRSRKLPVYRHDQAAESFIAIRNSLLGHLSQINNPQAIPLPLESRANGLHVSVIAQAGLLQDMQLVLAVRSAIDEQTLIQQLPSHVKIGPIEQINELINLQLPAIGIKALRQVPYQIPWHHGTCYFLLDHQHDLWPRLQHSSGLALHIAGNFPELALELWAIKPTASST